MKSFSSCCFVSWILAFLSFHSAVRANVLSSQLRGSASSAVDDTADPSQGGGSAFDANDSLFETDLTSLRAKRSLLSNDTVVCRVTVDIQGFENGSDVETPMCIPIREGIESDWTVPIPSTNSSELVAMHNQIVLEQGVLVVTISGVVRLKRGRMELTPESQLQVLPPEDAAVHYDDPQVRRRISMRSEQDHRQLAVTGTKTIAIVRVMAAGTYNNITKAQLMSAWFGAQATSFKNQMSSCSNSALQFTQGPYYNIALSQNIGSFSSFDALQAAIEKKLLAVAKKPLNTIASHVVYCYPAKSPGGVWYARGTMNHYRTMYNHNWCASLSGGAHEIGHNYGLQHSSAGGSEFGDRSGNMGSSGRLAGTPAKCYNGHKHWLLGWFPSKRLSISGTAKVRLAAFVDVNLAASNEYVVLNVKNKYFVQYNRAKKHNVGTELSKDMVTVTAPLSDGKSNQAAALAVGESYNAGGTVIRVCSAATTSSGADVVVVAIGTGC